MAKAGNFKKALKTLKNISTTSGRDSALNVVIIEQVKRGDGTGEKASAQKISVETTRKYSAYNVVNGLAKAGYIKQALNVAKHDTKIYRDFSYAEIAIEQVKTGDSEGARVTAASVPKRDGRAGVIREIAKSKAISGDTDDAIKEAKDIAQKQIKAMALADIAETMIGKKTASLKPGKTLGVKPPKKIPELPRNYSPRPRPLTRPGNTQRQQSLIVRPTPTAAALPPINLGFCMTKVARLAQTRKKPSAGCRKQRKPEYRRRC